MPIGSKYPVKKGVTNGYPTHVKNGDGGMYGDLLKCHKVNMVVDLKKV